MAGNPFFFSFAKRDEDKEPAPKDKPAESPSGFSFAPAVPAASGGFGVKFSGSSIFGAGKSFGGAKGGSDASPERPAGGSPVQLRRSDATVKGRGAAAARGGASRGPPAAPTKRRSSATSPAASTAEQVSTSRTLRLTGVPAEANKETVLRKHFAVYGGLESVRCQPSLAQATLVFRDHQTAAKAKVGGAVLRPGTKPLRTAWVIANTKPKASPTNIPQARLPPKPTKTERELKLDASAAVLAKAKRGAGAGKGKETMTSSLSTPSLVTVNQPLAKVLSRAEMGAQLRLLIGKPATTLYDKYCLLEERDKILRKGRSRRADVRRAVAVTGTCEDMCPEKERYIREVQARMSSYEMGPDGLVDPAKCVKDYSRSSADQEEPLPHELRPSFVLNKTLAYLFGTLSCPQGDDAKLAAWYDFLWNRTRAIRKDITQQMLTDLGAVDLVEKCARLHILASHHLCHLEVAEFDQKMNTENLTKCLQTLRHLYEDAAGRGEECPREAEFRAYDILLHLHDADILRQVLAYSRRIRESPPVRLGLRLLVAVQSNDWVRFFRLVRQRCDFLQACLAHRYFNNVRAAALRTLVQAYSQPNARTSFPLAELQDALALESLAETREFVAAHGLLSSDGGQRVLVSKGAFYQADPPLGVTKSPELVEAKAGERSIGEILYGGPVEAWESLAPASQSFDAQHRYTQHDPVLKPYLDPDAAEAEEAAAVAARHQQMQVEQMRRQEAAHLAHTTSSLVNSWLSPWVSAVATDAYVDAFAKDFIYDVADEETARIAEDAHRHHRMAAERRRREAERQARAQAAKDLTNSLVKETVAETLHETARRVMLQERMVARRRAEVELLSRVAADAADEIVEELTQETVHQCHREQVEGPLRALAVIRHRLALIRLRQLFAHWRSVAAARARRRHLLEHFPTRLNGSLESAARELGCVTAPPLLKAPSSGDLHARLEAESSRWEWSVERAHGVVAVEGLKRVRASLSRALLRASLRAWRSLAAQRRAFRASASAIRRGSTSSLKRAAEHFAPPEGSGGEAPAALRRRWDSPPPSPRDVSFELNASSLGETEAELMPRRRSEGGPSTPAQPLWTDSPAWMAKRPKLNTGPSTSSASSSRLEGLAASLASLRAQLQEEDRRWTALLHGSKE